MSDIADIALRKISIDFTRLIDKLKTDSEAMHSRHAAEGMLRSGATIAWEVENCKGAFHSLRDICNRHVQPLIDESIVLSESSLLNFKAKISDSFLELNSEAFETMTKSCNHSSKPQLREEFMPEINNEMIITRTEVNLFIDEKVLFKRNRGIRGATKSAIGWLSKIFTSGTG